MRQREFSLGPCADLGVLKGGGRLRRDRMSFAQS